MELNKLKVFDEQLVRPTGLVDIKVLVRPTKDQVDDLIFEAKNEIKKANESFSYHAQKNGGSSK